jgi:protease-4
VATLNTLLRALTSWYFAAPAAVILGLVIGGVVFFFVAPGKPSVGVINIPFTVIDEGSAFVISRHLDYAMQDDSIKAVVISLSSPGGGASSSERLYIHTRRLRDEKPVVMVMNGLVASGGYMMSMAANYIYAQPSSLVGNVGVVGISGGTLPPILPEIITTTGPHKLTGGSKQHWVELIDRLNEVFAQMVIRERGDRLRMTKAQLLEGSIYSGAQAVSLGMVDAIGVTGDGVEKAAELAGIGRYSITDVNAAVFEKYGWRAQLSYVPPGQATADAADDPASPHSDGDGAAAEDQYGQPWNGQPWMGALGQEQVNPLSNLPIGVGQPNIYYLYAGYGR